MKSRLAAMLARIERRKRRRSCSRKRRYRDDLSAKEALHRLSGGRARAVVPVRYYGPCAFCRGFHLTSKEAV